jgi:type VI secretion system secreted protein VgrG
MEQLIQNDSRTEIGGQRLETIKGNSTLVLKSEEHRTTTGERKVQLLAGDHLQVAGSSHTRVGEALVMEAGFEVHLNSGVDLIIDAGVSLTLKAGGQHILISPAGIFSSVPIMLGGVPMPGMPAMPLMPGQVQSLVADTIFASQGQVDKLLSGQLACPLCEMSKRALKKA